MYDWHNLRRLHGLDVIETIEHSHVPAEIFQLCLSIYNRIR
jgi:hypothetical protein